MIAASVVLAAGVGDRLFGEPPEAVHPVALFGRLIAPLDTTWAAPRAVGVVAAVVLPGLFALTAGLAVAVGSLGHPLLGMGVAAALLWSLISLRLLCATARDVVDRTEDDLAGAREAVVALAGRNPATLSAAQIRSAAVESAAENLSDGLVGPLAGFGVTAAVVGQWAEPPTTLAAATAMAAWIKAVNTMDSMVGYPSKPVGWAAARLDDIVMWLPARLTAILLSAAAVTPDPLLAGRRWARNPDSPNAGWPMATLAAALQIRLEKPGAYTLNPVASLPTTAVAHRGIALVARAGWLAIILTAVMTLA